MWQQRGLAPRPQAASERGWHESKPALFALESAGLGAGCDSAITGNHAVVALILGTKDHESTLALLKGGVDREHHGIGGWHLRRPERAEGIGARDSQGIEWHAQLQGLAGNGGGKAGDRRHEQRLGVDVVGARHRHADEPGGRCGELLFAGRVKLWSRGTVLQDSVDKLQPVVHLACVGECRCDGRGA